jgi:hypothetical protein
MSTGFATALEFLEESIGIDKMLNHLAGEDQIEARIVKGNGLAIQIAVTGIDPSVLWDGNVLAVDVNASRMPAAGLPEQSPITLRTTNVEQAAGCERIH